MDILRPGRKERSKLDAIQRQIEAVRNEIDAVINAEAADVDLREHCRLAVQAHGTSNGRPYSTIEHLRRSDAFVDDQDFERMARLDNRKLPDLSWRALIEIVGEDRFIDALFQAAKGGATSAPGLSNSERSRKIADLRAQVTKLEWEEERQVLLLEESGQVILRRADCDAQVLLSVWADHGETRAPA